ncbi:42 kDa endochitinase-like protein [Boeremia exigua]|uniref:42 kDa endochitinase-like protein n=1 Tax=Boeremia exigua TaxID=749465 RepID=UPI001E8DD4B9|nr:42 kDa endochitinase-like protein [Boeremia exigua]KAH6622449.1 42 kDa endochitinase-like protein [Boeremia exigua]
MYLTGQHDIVPESFLVSRVTHVALAFMRSEVFNVPNQEEWPLFTTVAEVRTKFKSGTKIQVAIGGWGNTDGFSEAAKTEQSRRLFAENIRAMIETTGADGVDIDWEYPGGNGEDYKQHPNSEKAWEIEAYPKLLAEIRAAIGPHKLITAAVPGLPRDMIAFTETTLPKIYESIDFLNVMSYDLMNRRDGFTKHHSGLDGTIQALHGYTNPAVHTKNLNIGLGFYIKWYRTASNETCDLVPAIGCRTELMEDPITGADLGKAGAFSWHDEVPTELADSFAKALKNGVDDMTGGLFRGHYYMDKQENIFWSWDTPDSIGKKLDTLFDHVNGHEGYKDLKDIGGVFAWGLGEDAPHFEHLKAANEALNSIGAKDSAINPLLNCEPVLLQKNSVKYIRS